MDLAGRGCLIKVNYSSVLISKIDTILRLQLRCSETMIFRIMGEQSPQYFDTWEVAKICKQVQLDY